MCVTRSTLKQKAREIIHTNFGNIDENANTNYLETYWKHLFGLELKIIKTDVDQKKDILNIPSSPAMILTLGTSLEPLVLAVHLIQPRELFVLYTQTQHFRKLEKALRTTGWQGTNKIKKINIGLNATSASVFKTLRGKGSSGNNNNGINDLINILSDDNNQRDKIVFDITGAKKTISGGCFLFAAYYDIPVYYMDFGNDPDDYYENLGRPLPGACYYTKQKNPIAGFCLKDIDKIKNYFDKEQYTIAKAYLDNVIDKMKMNSEYFDANEMDQYKKVSEITDIYIKWNNGFWGDVFNRKTQLPASTNQIWIKNLSDYPREDNWEEPVYMTDLYKQQGCFLSYLIMEFAVLSRAIEKRTLNYRMIFLRIFGLEEILLGFMCYRLINLGNVNAIVDKTTKQSALSDDDHINLSVSINYGGIERLLKGQSTICQRLVKPNGIGREKWNFKISTVVKLSWRCKCTISNKIKKNLTIFSETRHIRNKAVHSITPVDKNLTEKIRGAFENLVNGLMPKDSGTTVKWFDGATNLDNITTLLGQEQWYKDNGVAPLKWDDLMK